MAEHRSPKPGVAGSSPVSPAIRDNMDIDQRIDLVSALNKLSPRQRKVVILWAQGYTQQEIADEYGVAQRTISRWIQKSVSKMRELSPYVIEDT